MNRLRIFGLLFVLALGAMAAVPAPAAAQVHASVNVSFFYDSLAPYGQWVNNASYGSVWRPTHIAAGWRPYMNGRWLYTTAGWGFDSYEPWGWATFHYGRWLFDPYYGWVWVPGTAWSPAWVDFQIGDGWVGWAPLPPGVSVGASFGYGGYRSRIDPRGYCFVDDRRFLDSRVDRWVEPWDRNARYLRSSRDANRFTTYGDVTVNRGLPVDRIERSVRRAVPRVPIVDVASSSEIASRRDRGFAAYRPNVRARIDHKPAVVQPPLAARRTPVADTRGGRNRVEVNAGRPSARVIHSSPSPRIAVDARTRHRVETSTPSSARSRRHEVGVESPGARSVQPGVRHGSTTERRNAVADRSRVQRPVQHTVRELQRRAEHGVRPQQARASHAKASAPNKPQRQQKQQKQQRQAHGHGRPHGG